MAKKLFLTPIIILGLIFIVLGLRWMLVDEPWMLDKVANEERLNMTFEKLFSEEINDTLPGYLKQIYRFFGLWVSIIGLFILSFSKPEFIENKAFDFKMKQYLSDVARGIRIAVRNTIWQSVYVFSIIILSLIPFIGWIAPFIAILIECYYF